jgi:hypothetical protein
VTGSLAVSGVVSFDVLVVELQPAAMAMVAKKATIRFMRSPMRQVG